MLVVAGNLPCQGGAYALLIRLNEPLQLDIPRFRGHSLAPGLYAYCGSAYGPGGIRARVSRHLRTGKSTRWHIDRLTAAGKIQQIAIRPGGQECALVGKILASGGTVALPGFGSSDCRQCPAHLLELPPTYDLRRFDFFEVV